MNVLVAASKSDEAIPLCRCDEETKRRGMPRGVGRGVEEQKSPVSSESSENRTVTTGRVESEELELFVVLDLTMRSSRAAAVLLALLKSLDGESGVSLDAVS